MLFLFLSGSSQGAFYPEDFVYPGLASFHPSGRYLPEEEHLSFGASMSVFRFALNEGRRREAVSFSGLSDAFAPDLQYRSFHGRIMVTGDWEVTTGLVSPLRRPAPSSFSAVGSLRAILGRGIPDLLFVCERGAQNR